MKISRNRAMIVFPAIWGLAIWLAMTVASGRSEAWDSPLYFAAGFPLLLIGAGVFGWIYKEKGWRCGLCMAAGHAAGLLVTGLVAGQGFGLFPMTVFAILMLSMPLVIVASVGAMMSRYAARMKKP